MYDLVHSKSNIRGNVCQTYLMYVSIPMFFPDGVRVVAERVEHETAAVAETLWPSQSTNSDAEELAEPRCPPVEGNCHDGVVLQ